MACQKQVKTRIAATLLLALLLPLVSVRAAESSTPSARELLAQVRLNETAQNGNFAGKLKMSNSPQGKIAIPFLLSMRGSTISYQFTNPPETFILRLEEKGAKLDDTVRGTDISYEDLSLKFLYWSNAVVEKDQETLSSRTCWIVRAVPSSKGESQYDMVRLWIESTGGLLQGECYKGGKLVRRFKVIGVQSAHDTSGYILKTMRIQRIDEAGKDLSPTYLELEPR